MHKVIPDFNPNLLSEEGIEAISAYRSFFETNNEFGIWEQGRNSRPWTLPICNLRREANEFITKCYDHNFVQIFDWGKWSSENEELVNFGAGIEDLEIEGIIRVITAWCRGDRFCSGTLLGVMNDGLMLRLLMRLEKIKNVGS